MARAADMIRIERGAEALPGIWEYAVPSLHLCGKSRQPLLDACRQIKRMGGDTSQRCGMFREGRERPDISCVVERGAELTVSESDAGIRFRKFRTFDFSGLRSEREVV